MPAPVVTTLLLAATRPEIQPTARALGLRWQSSTQAEAHLPDHRHVIAIVTGVGQARARAALDRHWPDPPPTEIISLGFAGGLAPHHRPGHLLAVGKLINESHHPIPLDQPGSATLLTLDRMIADVAEKRQLHQRFTADAVDMETHSLARHVQDWNARHREHPPVRFLALRAISDPADLALPPEMVHWVTPAGRPRLAPVLAWLARHPHRMPMLLRLHRHTRQAAASLARAVRTHLAPTPR